MSWSKRLAQKGFTLRQNGLPGGGQGAGLHPSPGDNAKYLWLLFKLLVVPTALYPFLFVCAYSFVTISSSVCAYGYISFSNYFFVPTALYSFIYSIQYYFTICLAIGLAFS
jgi:hypothetical protein